MNNPTDINQILKKKNVSGKFLQNSHATSHDFDVNVASKAYFTNGWKVIPVTYQSKACHIKGWQNYVIKENAIPVTFSDPSNIGVLLGESQLTDIDVDSALAFPFLHWLPPTGAKWGRKGNLNSHHLYKGIYNSKQFKTSTGIIIEIRSQGCYAVMPPSIHPVGEPYKWESNGEPGLGDKLEHAVTKIAIAATCLPFWKQGSRHSIALSLSSALIKAGWSVEEVLDIVLTIAKATGDNELSDRKKAVLDTAENFKKGGTIAGINKLIEIIGMQDANAIISWTTAKNNDGIGNNIGEIASKARSVKEKRTLAKNVRKDLAERGVFYRTTKSADLLFFTSRNVNYMI